MSRPAEHALVDVFFALGDATRLSVVKRLAAGAALSATVLADGGDLTRQAMAKHLQVLEQAGLVTHAKQGREVLYSLAPRRLMDAREFLDGVSAGWDRAIERLRGLVETEPARGRRR